MTFRQLPTEVFQFYVVLARNEHDITGDIECNLFTKYLQEDVRLPLDISILPKNGERSKSLIRHGSCFLGSIMQWSNK